MPYRFNPPPNWPVGGSGWTPPPGWQPDPEWGPAPEGWNFWIDEQTAPADPGPSGAGTSGDAEEVGAEPGPQPSDSEPSNTESSNTESLSPEAVVPAPSDVEPSDPEPPRLEALDAEPLEPGASDVEPTPPPVSSDLPGVEADVPEADVPEATVSIPGASVDAPSVQSPAAAAVPAPSAYSYGDSTGSGASYGVDRSQDSSRTQASPSSEPAAHAATPAQDGAPGIQGAAAPGPAGSGADGHSPYASSSYGPGTYDSAASQDQASEKGIVARFWWVGCIILVLLALLIGAIALAAAFLMGPRDQPSRGDETVSEAASTSAEASSSAASDSTSLLGPDVDTSDGQKYSNGSHEATVVLSNPRWVQADQIVSASGGTVSKPGSGSSTYLAVQVDADAIDGDVYLSPSNFAVTTTDGQKVAAASSTYGLDSNYRADAGQHGKFVLLFDVPEGQADSVVLWSAGDSVSWKMPR